MPITPSAARDVDRLIDELGSSDDLRRETALARLAVIGARAVSRLSAVATRTDAPVALRTSALQALEAIGDSRALSSARTCAMDGDDRVAVAALGVLARLARGKGPDATRAFEQLTTAALDTDASVERRLAALTGLTGPPQSALTVREQRVLAPIFEALQSDPSPRLRARVARRDANATLSIESLIDVDGPGLPDDAALAAAVIRDEGTSTRVTVLRRAIDAVRERESALPRDARESWAAVRGLLHQQLATRESRLAVFDLRESFETATRPLPPGFVAAAAAVGDASCLEPIAAAWVRHPDPWWRDHLAEAFRVIVKREALTRKHPAIKKVMERWPAAAELAASAKK